jgi:hypothetical protein
MSIMKKTFLLGIPALALVFGLLFTACSDGDDGDGDGLPGLSGAPTGVTEIKVEGVQVTEDTRAEDSYVPVYTNTAATGDVYWSGKKVGTLATGGKLTFTIGTPDDNSLTTLTADTARYLIDSDNSHALTVTPVDVQCALLQDLTVGDGGNKYLSRYYTDSDGKTWMKSKSIAYVYVDKDVGITRAAFTSEGTQEYDGKTYTFANTYNAVSLSLKAGWNLIQTTQDLTATNDSTNQKTTVSYTLATDEVPWVYND